MCMCMCMCAPMHLHVHVCVHVCACACVYCVCVYHMPTQGLIKHKKVDHDRVKALSLVSRLIQIAESVRETNKLLP